MATKLRSRESSKDNCNKVPRDCFHLTAASKELAWHREKFSRILLNSISTNIIRGAAVLICMSSTSIFALAASSQCSEEKTIATLKELLSGGQTGDAVVKAYESMGIRFEKTIDAIRTISTLQMAFFAKLE